MPGSTPSPPDRPSTHGRRAVDASIAALTTLCGLVELLPFFMQRTDMLDARFRGAKTVDAFVAAMEATRVGDVERSHHWTTLALIGRSLERVLRELDLAAVVPDGGRTPSVTDVRLRELAYHALGAVAFLERTRDMALVADEEATAAVGTPCPAWAVRSMDAYASAWADANNPVGAPTAIDMTRRRLRLWILGRAARAAYRKELLAILGAVQAMRCIILLIQARAREFVARGFAARGIE